jgi:streptogramin lyase
MLSVSETLTCGVPLGTGQFLVGTYARGLQIFDGTRTRPFGGKGLLTGGIRINDLCETEGGFVAAAIENVGIVFFDRQGRMLQVLDRALDHRLSHVRRLVAGTGGEIWGQVSQGIVRVEFPARLSHYEPLIGSSLTIAHPYRLDGKLWVFADGRIHRGIYDADGRLVRFDEDTPPDRFVFAFSCALGRPVVGTDRGAYYRDANEWKAFFPLSANLHVLHPQPINGRWLYAAVGEVGWLRPTADGIEVERIPVSGLGNLYNTVSVQDGTIWFELGNSRVGRLRIAPGEPVVDFFDRQDGLPEGWVNLFAIGDHVSFNVEGQILRFDEATHHFIPDMEFGRRFPGATAVVGRPARDAQGRVWMSTNGAVHVYEQRGESWQDLGERMPPGFQPNFFTLESNGRVWMHADRRLARFDPMVPAPAVVPLKTLVTHVTLPGSGRTFFTNDTSLPEFDYADSSFVAHFVASGNPFEAPVRFEVMLEGAGNSWVSAGGGGSAAFNRLKEGRHVLRVRPLSGGMIGEEATLKIVVRPPWYRARSAYIGYAAGAVGFILFAIWVARFLSRRENRRLQQLVVERTRQLVEANTRVADMEEEAARAARSRVVVGGGKL